MGHWERWLRPALQRALDCLAPRTCAYCDTSLAHSEPFCRGCDALCSPASSQTLPSGLVVLSASRYRGPVTEAVKRLKYGDRADLGIPIGAWAAGRVAHSMTADCVVMPVPLHAKRLANRGYNQAALLARGFAPTAGARLMTRWLTRVSDTRAQAALSAAERHQNVQSAFRASPEVAGRRVWLMDDVVTTGATASACVEALSRAGADVQGVVCVAIAGRDERGDDGGQLI